MFVEGDKTKCQMQMCLDVVASDSFDVNLYADDQLPCEPFESWDNLIKSNPDINVEGASGVVAETPNHLLAIARPYDTHDEYEVPPGVDADMFHAAASVYKKGCWRNFANTSTVRYVLDFNMWPRKVGLTSTMTTQHTLYVP